jgi:hypothetical protein
VRTAAGSRGRAADPSSARNIARYLVGLRPVLTDACAVRADWVHRLGVLMADAKTGNVLKVTQGAGALGREYGLKFRAVRSRIDILNAPPECGVCHASVRAWAEALQRSCAALEEIGQTGKLSGLRVAQDQLADARSQAHRFNDEYARLSQDLRQRVAAVRRRTDVLPNRRQRSPS